MYKICRLCEALSRPCKATLENTVLIESEHFVVMPTLGQFIEGWLMVVSKSHKRCAREHSTHELAELDDLVARTQTLVHTYYGPAMVFEHGPSDSPGSQAGCCVEHTHIHVVPCANSQNFFEKIAFRRVGECTISDLSLSIQEKSRGYLIAGSDMASRRLNLYEVDCPAPRQYLRQVLAVVCNKTALWDWRQNSCLENIQKTLRRLDAKSI